MGNLMGTGDGAKIQNNMARVMHGYLVCGHVGEEHLIFLATLAADLVVIHPGSVPTGCEETCDTAPEAKKKRETHRIDAGRIKRHKTPTPAR